jgi:predicted transcriptional regulator
LSLVQATRVITVLMTRHTSARGMSAISIGIRDLNKEMKQRHGLKQQEVAHNMDYLIQVGWVREVIKERDFTTGRGTRLIREQVKYKISEIGINHLEAATVFSKPRAGTHINITNIQGVTVIGDGNIVNTELTELSAALDQLDDLLEGIAELSEEQKLDVSADIATIRNQIAKKQPGKEIVARAWKAIEGLSKIAGLTAVILKIGELIVRLIG